MFCNASSLSGQFPKRWFCNFPFLSPCCHARKSVLVLQNSSDTLPTRSVILEDRTTSGGQSGVGARVRWFKQARVHFRECVCVYVSLFLSLLNINFKSCRYKFFTSLKTNDQEEAQSASPWQKGKIVDLNSQSSNNTLQSKDCTTKCLENKGKANKPSAHQVQAAPAASVMVFKRSGREARARWSSGSEWRHQSDKGKPK